MGRTLLALLAAALLLPATAVAQPCPVPVPVPQCEEPQPEPTPEPPPDAPPEQPPPPPPAPASAVEGSANLGVDPGRTGYFADATLVPPLEARWRRKVALDATAPLYGQGRIYLSFDGRLHALDPRTGRDVWSVPARGVARAYDAGRVFMVETSGIRAHSAADGAVLWTVPFADAFGDPALPVATAGMVYVGTGGPEGVMGIDAADGRVVWKSGKGEHAPVVDDTGVYASSPCEPVLAWGRVDGAKLWEAPIDCEARGLGAAAVHRGRLYVPENRTVYDARTGAVAGSWDGGRPMFAGDVGITTTDGGIKAVDLDDGRRLWGKLTIDPKAGVSGLHLIAGGYAYGMSTDRVYALDVRTGATVWTGAIPDPFGTSGGLEMGVAPGLVMALANERLTAFESVFNPGPRGIEIGPRAGRAISGTKGFVGGIVGSALRASGKVRLEVDVAPFGRWRRGPRGAIQPEGWIGFKVRVARNTRLRVVAGGRRSNVATLYAYPRVLIRVSRTGASSFRTTATMRYARRGRGLGGRRAFLYLWRDARRRYERLGAATVRATGRAGARAVFVHRVPAGVQVEDTVATCVRGQARAGLGQNVALLRRCGRRTIRF